MRIVRILYNSPRMTYVTYGQTARGGRNQKYTTTAEQDALFNEEDANPKPAGAQLSLLRSSPLRLRERLAGILREFQIVRQGHHRRLQRPGHLSQVAPPRCVSSELRRRVPDRSQCLPSCPEGKFPNLFRSWAGSWRTERTAEPYRGPTDDFKAFLREQGDFPPLSRRDAEHGGPG